jgi:hypothetical protein
MMQTMPWVLVNNASSKTRPSRPKQSPTRDREPELIYRIRVDLQGLRPPVWRRFTILGSVSLDQLHRAIQTAMDWSGGHLYAIEVGVESYGDPDPELGLFDAKRVRLDQIAQHRGEWFTYVYDFGDDWRHKVLVEDILPLMPDDVVPQCLKGKRNRPPEDVGGVWGYEEFLSVLADPSHPEYQEMLDWVGGGWDSEEFDREECEAQLQRLARRARWARPRTSSE